MKKIFVYGTLKSNGRLNADWLGLGCVLEQPLAVVPNFTLVDLGPYPAAVPVRARIANSVCYVRGEVWQVPDNVHARVKAMELGAGYQCKTIAWASFANEMAMVNSRAMERNQNAHGTADMFYFKRADDEVNGQIGYVALDQLRDPMRQFGLNEDYSEAVVVNWTNNDAGPDAGIIAQARKMTIQLVTNDRRDRDEDDENDEDDE